MKIGMIVVSGGGVEDVRMVVDAFEGGKREFKPKIQLCFWMV